MLDPELFDQLAAHPEKNAPEVNVALAEQGHPSVLRLLARCRATGADALAVIAARIDDEAEDLEDDEDDDWGSSDPLLEELDRALIAHPNAGSEVRDAVLRRHRDQAFYVLAAAAHSRATLAALERATDWPARFAVYDRTWLQLVAPHRLGKDAAAEWAADDDVERREAVALWTDDDDLLEGLSMDPDRRVRRAVASNPAALTWRRQLAENDAALEVRARAAGSLGEHHTTASIESARFAAALRAMESHGVLKPDVAEALAGDGLDEEGALLAARVLPREQVVDLVRRHSGDPRAEGARGLAAGLALRTSEDQIDDDHQMRELVVDASKALAGASDCYGILTGKARLACWMGQAIGTSAVLAAPRMLEELRRGGMGGESMVLAHGALARSGWLDELCVAAVKASKVAPSLLELAWRCERISDDVVIALARKLTRAKRRGQDIPDDELDLDPACRDLEVLEKVVLAVSRRVTVSPRAALSVVALDSRRVRYVLTAMPQWKGRLSGAMLARVLRQNAGALSAGRAEARSRGAEVKGWAERMLNDIELSVALAIGHTTADAILVRFQRGRHKLADGVGLASGAEVRAVVQGPEVIQPLLRWARQNKGRDPAALAMWLLLERYDRHRAPGMIASAIDSLAGQSTVSTSLTEALAVLERRDVGRLEQVHAQTPRGRATLQSAIARAYRAVGGLRDEH